MPERASAYLVSVRVLLINVERQAEANANWKSYPEGLAVRTAARGARPRLREQNKRDDGSVYYAHKTPIEGAEPNQ